RARLGRRAITDRAYVQHVRRRNAQSLQPLRHERALRTSIEIDGACDAPVRLVRASGSMARATLLMRLDRASSSIARVTLDARSLARSFVEFCNATGAMARPARHEVFAKRG